MAAVLIVDDSRAVRAWLRRVIGGAGHDVTESASASEALSRISERAFDLVISDVNMDDVNGLELVRAVRRTHSRRVLPILVYTTESAPELVEEGRRAGASGWMLKPIDGETLRPAGSRSLEQRSA